MLVGWFSRLVCCVKAFDWTSCYCVKEAWVLTCGKMEGEEAINGNPSARPTYIVRFYTYTTQPSHSIVRRSGAEWASASNHMHRQSNKELYVRSLADLSLLARHTTEDRHPASYHAIDCYSLFLFRASTL